MNKKDRKELSRALALVSEALEIIVQLRDGEQDKFDNLPEGLQSSEMGEKVEEWVNSLEDIESNLTEIVDETSLLCE